MKSFWIIILYQEYWGNFDYQDTEKIISIYDTAFKSENDARLALDDGVEEEMTKDYPDYEDNGMFFGFREIMLNEAIKEE